MTKTIITIALSVAAGAVGGALLIHYCKKNKDKCGCGGKCGGGKTTATPAVAKTATTDISTETGISKVQEEVSNGESSSAMAADGRTSGWPNNNTKWG